MCMHARDRQQKGDPKLLHKNEPIFLAGDVRGGTSHSHCALMEMSCDGQL